MAQATTEIVEQDAGGLPQLNVIEDGSYTNQIAWLLLTFVVLYVLVSKMIVPRVTSVLEEREEKIAGDLDIADRLRREAEEMREGYEAAIADARANAQNTLLAAKEAAQADMAKALADLDTKLSASADEAEKRIVAAKTEALTGLSDIATDVAATLVAKLGGVDADEAAVQKAVKSALAEKGA